MCVKKQTVWNRKNGEAERERQRRKGNEEGNIFKKKR
jgi:hypothetical protein